MNNNFNENSLAQNKISFELPTIVDSNFNHEELADEMAGLRLSFQKIKIPSGGSLQFEIPGEDPDNPEYEKTIDGVIIYHHAASAYWPEGSEYDDDTAPLCSSNDGMLGIGEPGGVCATCHNNTWGSAASGKGKACKNMRILYLLCSGQYMPIQLALPPTSISPFSDFYGTAFAARRRGSCGSVVRIALKKKSNGKDDYSVATFSRLYDFSGEELQQIKAYADNFKEQLKGILLDRTTEAMNKPDSNNIIEPSINYDKIYNKNESFSVSSPDSYVDGDKDELPA